MKKIIICFLVITIAILFSIGVFEEDNTYKTMSVSSDIVYSLNNIPNDFQKVTNLSKREEDVICAISKGLVSKSIDGSIVCNLAESYFISEDGIEYVFNLKKDNCWSDGTALTSKDIVDFFKELIKCEDEENIEALLSVYGARDYKMGIGTFENNVAIDCNNNCIKFRLNERNDNFLHDLTKVQYRVRKSLPLWNEIKSYYLDIVYSGDYYISNFDTDTIKIISNKKEAQIRSIVFVKDEDEEKAMAAFELNKRDIIENTSISFINETKNKKGVLTFPSDKSIYAAFNYEKMDITNRRAIYKSLNEALQDYEKENNYSIELSEGCYFREEKDDLEKVQNRKVAINSVEEKIELTTINICALEYETNKGLCEYLVQWFKNNKNISITYKLVNEERYNKIKQNNNYDILLINNENINSFFNIIEGFIKNDEIELYSELENIQIEEKLFANYYIMPMIFLNQNICLSSKNLNISFDYNGNLIINK